MIRYILAFLLCCIPLQANAITQNFTITVTVTPVATGITLSATSVTFPSTVNANSFVATITVAVASGTYAGTLSLSGTDASKFALSNGGVYPCNLMVGSASICTTGSPCTYNVSVTAP